MDSIQYNKSNGTMYFLVILVSLALGFGGAYFLFNKKMQFVPSTKISSLNTALRKLWSDHVYWTRSFIVATIADIPETKEVTERLMKNQEDLGNSIVKYYGTEAGNKLTNLLKEHILKAAALVAAAKVEDKDKFKVADKEAYQNADEIATFLSSANPNWTQSDLQNMLYEHLNLLTKETQARIKKDWKGDISNFDKVYEQALMMADEFTTGIVKQFPDKF